MKVVSRLLLIIIVSALLISASTSVSTRSGDYDPWVDLDDDGDIDIFDIVAMAGIYGSEGEPFAAKASLAYDSDWINCTDLQGESFDVTHNLSISNWNNQNITVEVIGKTDLQTETLHRQLGLTSQSNWKKSYGGTSREMANSMVKTGDGGFAIAGYVWDFGGPNYYELSLVKTDSEGNLEFATMFGGSNTEVANSLVQTTDGGYALAGYTSSYGAGNFDFWLVKTDSDGFFEWSQTYGGTGYDLAHSLIQTGDGGYALGGITDSFGAGSNDFWLIKTDKRGNMQWNQTYGGIDDDKGTALVQTGDNGYAFAGYTGSYGVGSYDSWLVKTYSNGTLEWSQTYGGTNADLTTSLVQTADGGFALAGYTASYGVGGSDFWLVKTDSSGSFEWNQTYGGAISDYAHSVVQTEDGGYALAGETNSYGAGSYDFWLVKTYSNGTLEWTQTYGGAQGDYAASVVQTDDGGYAIAGETDSFDFSNTDIWLVKTGVESGLTWTHDTLDSITLYRGATDTYWNYVRVRIWKIKETP